MVGRGGGVVCLYPNYVGTSNHSSPVPAEPGPAPVAIFEAGKWPLTGGVVRLAGICRKISQVSDSKPTAPAGYSLIRAS